MCPWCKLATQLAGMYYMCRPCWRKTYKNRKSSKPKK